MNCNGQIFILCEDTVHYHFAKKYFELLGFKPGKIRGNYNPKGRSTGSGAEFVKNRYEQEVKAFRSKAAHLNCILVVIIDDDTKNHAKHLKPAPSANEAILIFSPIRNIESWFRYIDEYIDKGDTGIEIPEKTGKIDDTGIEIPDETGKIKDYAPHYKKGCKPTKFAKKLKETICNNGLPEQSPSSLQHACKELERLNH